MTRVIFIKGEIITKKNASYYNMQLNYTHLLFKYNPIKILSRLLLERTNLKRLCCPLEGDYPLTKALSVSKIADAIDAWLYSQRNVPGDGHLAGAQQGRGSTPEEPA